MNIPEKQHLKMLQGQDSIKSGFWGSQGSLRITLSGSTKKKCAAGYPRRISTLIKNVGYAWAAVGDAACAALFRVPRVDWSSEIFF